MMPLQDGCGRRVDHLRLSVTSSCNMTCAYCRPRGENASDNCSVCLSDVQRFELVRLLYSRYGLSQVRITGGEPLLHQTLAELVSALHEFAPDLTLAMTTNGRLLAAQAKTLRAAGLSRLNISLDSLDPDCYRRITGAPINDVLRGIDIALEVGFPPPKLNAVVLRGINDGELIRLAKWAWSRRAEMRFLEAMPIGPAARFNRARFVSADEIRGILRSEFSLAAIPTAPGETARRYRATDGSALGTVGVIAPLSEPFCGQCRRIRVTAEGMLYPCLLDSHRCDLRPVWLERRYDEERLRSLLVDSLADKREFGPRRQYSAMVQLGG